MKEKDCSNKMNFENEETLKKKENEAKLNVNRKIEMDVDEVLEVGGPCGKSQTLIQLLFMSACVTVTYHAVEGYFTGNNPSWRCKNITSTYNGSFAVRNTSKFCSENFQKEIRGGSIDFYERCQLDREDWEYLTDRGYSFVTEFDLVCDKAAIAAFATGSVYIGGLIGCIISGIIGDKYGRKIVMIGSQALVIASSLAASYTTSIWQLTAARIVLGGAQTATYSVGYTAVLEYVAPSYRTVSGMMYQMMFCCSQLFIDIVAYYQREWRTLQFYSSFACVISLLVCVVAPNSPRWLISTGQIEKAKEVLNKIAKYNGNPMEPYTLTTRAEKNEDSKNESQTYTYLDLFKSRKMFITTSVLCWIWITCALLYFAIALASSNLGGDMYQAFGLTAVADLPSYFVALFACNILGRKNTVLGSTLFAGIFIGCAAFVPQSYEYKYYFNIILAMLAKFFTTTAFNGIFLWTFEIYPTVIRSQGTAYCIAWERFGASVAPLLVSVLQRINYIIPFLIMSASAISCTVLGLMLPETIDCPTRETFEDFFLDANDFEDKESVTKSASGSVTEMGCDNNGIDCVEKNNVTLSSSVV